MTSSGARKTLISEVKRGFDLSFHAIYTDSFVFAATSHLPRRLPPVLTTTSSDRETAWSRAPHATHAYSRLPTLTKSLA